MHPWVRLGMAILLTAVAAMVHGGGLWPGEAEPERGLAADAASSERERDAHYLAGRWVGHLDLAGDERFVELTVTLENAVYRGAMTAWGGDESIAVRRIALGDQSRVTIEVDVDGASRTYRGDWQDDRIAGAPAPGTRQPGLRLHRAVDLSQSDFRPYIGEYRSDHGARWFVGSSDVAGRFYLAEADRQMGITPIGEDTFYGTTGEQITFTHAKDGAIVGLVRATPAGPQSLATRTESTTSAPLRVSQNRVSLAGELILPSGTGPFPAVVLVHGSGPETRERRRFLAYRFADSGIAAAIYDKRGTGESGGDWYSATFDDLVADALAVLASVGQHPHVNGDAVGLWGLSQGGWIVPLAASRSEEVSFAITVSASGVSPNAQELYRWHLALEALGYKGATMDAALKAIRLQQDLNAADIPGVDDLFLGLDFGYDPVPALEDLWQPVLAIWGAEDRVVPPQTSAVILQETLRTQRHPDVTVRIFEGAGHSLALAPTADGWVSLPPTYVTAMTNWIRERTLPQPELQYVWLSAQPSLNLDPSAEVIPVPTMPWYGRAIPQLATMLLLSMASLGVTLSWPVGYLVERLRRRSGSEHGVIWEIGLATSLFGAMGLYLVIGLVLTLGQFLMSDDGALLRYATAPVVRVLSWVTALAAPTLGVLTLVAGRKGLGSSRRVVLGAAIGTTGLVMILLLRYWQLLRL